MSRIAWIPWAQPVLSSDTDYGTVSASSSNTGAAPWKALDGSRTGNTTSWECSKAAIPAFWMWVLPHTVRIASITLYNKYSGSTNVTKDVQVFADESMTVPIGAAQTFAASAFSAVTVTPDEPVVTDTLFVYCSSSHGNVGNNYVGLGEVLITAEQQQTEYEVSFRDWNGTVLKTDWVASGAATPPTDPTRTGYSFAGWNGAFSDIQSDTTITATYTAQTFTVTFADWDGTVLDAQTVEYGADATPPADPARNGYLFDHWDGVYTHISANATVTTVYVIDPATLTGIAVTTPPAKTEYRQGESFDGEGMVVTATYSAAGSVVISDYTLSGFATDALGICTVTVSYQSYSADFDLHFSKDVVTEYCGYPAVASIIATLDRYTGVLTLSGTGTTKTFTSTTSILRAYRSEIRSIIVDTGVKVLGSYAFAGSAVETVALPDTLTGIGSNVFQYCTALTSVSAPAELLTLGDFAFDGSGLTGFTANGKLRSVGGFVFRGCQGLASVELPESISYLSVSTFYGSSVTDIYVDQEYGLTSGAPWGATNATVTWRTAPLDYLELLTLPAKTAYLYGELLDTAGMTVRLHYTDGSYTSVTDYTTQGYNGATLGEQSVSVIYRTTRTGFLVTVSNYVTGITVDTPPVKLDYDPGEVLDPTGLVVIRTYADGSTEVITDYTLSAIDPAIAGSQRITVTYGEVSTFFAVTCHYPAVLASLLDNTNGMTAIRENVSYDYDEDELVGADWFYFNGTSVPTLYVDRCGGVDMDNTGLNLRVCYQSSSSTFLVYRLEGTLTNGHRFLKLRVDGSTRYTSYIDNYRFIYELFLFDDESIFLNVVQTPTNSVYLGESSFVCGGVTHTLPIAANTPAVYSFYSADSTGTVWSLDPYPHAYLMTGISVTPPTKTAS